MAHDVFLSWTANDRAKAHRVAKALETHGLRVFWSHTIAPGDDWLERAKTKLDGIPCLVALWSVNSVNSTWVRSEAGEAAERGILVPVLVDRVRMPRLFR